jgi:hypothetical protein
MMAMKSPRQVPLAALLLAVSLAAPAVGQGKLIRLATSDDAEALPFPGQGATVMKDGRFATVWTQFLPSPAFASAHVQYIRGDGSTVLGPLGRAVTSSSRERATAVAAHAEEGVLVALERYDDSHSGELRLVVQWLDGKGRPRWRQGVSAAPVSGVDYQSGDALLASSDGGAFVCFTRAAFGPDLSVFCQRFSADGRRLWGLGGVQAATSNRIMQPPLAVADGNDGLLVFWQDIRHPSRGAGTVTFRGQRLGPDGSRLWGDEGRIVYMPRLPRNFGSFPPFDLVSDGSGGAILAFDDWPGPPSPIDTERMAIVQRVSGDGDNLWGSGGLVLASGILHLMDSLIAGHDGGAFVGVVTYYGPNYSTRLAFHRVTADGRSIWPAEGVSVVDPAVADQDDIQAFGSFDGGVLRLAWMHYVPVFRYEIRFGALDADGHRLAGATGIRLAPADTQKDLGGFAFNPETGTVFAAWGRFEFDDPYDADVHGAVYSSPSAP